MSHLSKHLPCLLFSCDFSGFWWGLAVLQSACPLESAPRALSLPHHRSKQKFWKIHASCKGDRNQFYDLSCNITTQSLILTASTGLTWPPAPRDERLHLRWTMTRSRNLMRRRSGTFWRISQPETCTNNETFKVVWAHARQLVWQKSRDRRESRMWSNIAITLRNWPDKLTEVGRTTQEVCRTSWVTLAFIFLRTKTCGDFTLTFFKVLDVTQQWLPHRFFLSFCAELRHQLARPRFLRAPPPPSTRD